MGVVDMKVHRMGIVRVRKMYGQPILSLSIFIKRILILKKCA